MAWRSGKAIAVISAVISAVILAVTAAMAASSAPGGAISAIGGDRDLRRNSGPAAFDVAVAGGTLAAEPQPESPEYFTDRGDRFFADGNLDRAIADYGRALGFYERTVTIDSLRAETHFKRGNALVRKGDLDAAISDYDKALWIDPELAWAHVNRGDAYARKGQYDRSIFDYRKALRLNPSFIEARRNRGHAYLASGDIDNAVADFSRAIDLDPSRGDLYLGRGAAHAQAGAIGIARADLDRAVDLEPGLVRAHVTRGAVLLRMGADRRALDDLGIALRLDRRRPAEPRAARTADRHIVRGAADPGFLGHPWAALHRSLDREADSPDRLRPFRVVLVQGYLQVLGADIGDDAATLGPDTRSAVRAFQADRGLPVDGRISDALIAALTAAGARHH